MTKALRIEDYAIIGDGHTAALVGRNGSIDWLCWPRFDSEACFSGLLGDDSHGHWSISPSEPATSTRRYRGDSLILETTFHAPGGEVTVIDFMPPKGAARAIIRLVTGKAGHVRMQTEFSPRFGHGRYDPWIGRRDW